MSKVDFQKHVRKNEGYILSEGTLKLEHLLSIAYDFIVLYNLKTSLKEDILECFEYDREVNGDLFLKQYYGEARLNEDYNATVLWNEDVYMYFNEIAPDGYYFGSSYGDGALIGWFKYEENF